MPDPVAWKVVEHGWRVVASDGEEVGHVHEIIGDPEADIFDGLSVSHGLLKRSRYVASELVGEIVEGTVHLTVDTSAFGRLDE